MLEAFDSYLSRHSIPREEVELDGPTTTGRLSIKASGETRKASDGGVVEMWLRGVSISCNGGVDVERRCREHSR